MPEKAAQKDGGGIYTAATILGKLDYATRAVNPEAVVEYRVKEAVLSTKREMRWCLGKAALEGKMALEALRCAD